MDKATENDNTAVLAEIKKLRGDQQKERDRKRRKKNISIIIALIFMAGILAPIFLVIAAVLSPVMGG